MSGSQRGTRSSGAAGRTISLASGASISAMRLAAKALSSHSRMRAGPLHLGRAVVGHERVEAAVDILAMAPFLHRAAQADERAHAGEERDVVDRLGQEVVGAGLEAAHPVGRLGQRRHHHHRNVARARDRP